MDSCFILYRWKMKKRRGGKGVGREGRRMGMSRWGRWSGRKRRGCIRSAGFWFFCFKLLVESLWRLVWRKWKISEYRMTQNKNLWQILSVDMHAGFTMQLKPGSTCEFGFIAANWWKMAIQYSFLLFLKNMVLVYIRVCRVNNGNTLSNPKTCHLHSMGNNARA